MTSAPEPEKKTGSNRTMVIVLIVLGAGALLLPCIGVTAAIAIPAFLGYTSRSKTQEARMQLRLLHDAAAAYYEAEHAGPGLEVSTGCVVPTARSAPPSTQPQVQGDWPAGFVAIGFTPPDPLRYQYEIESVGGCGHGPNETLYSFRAYGDLDGDGITSLFELSSGSDGDNRLRSAPGVYVEQELE